MEGREVERGQSEGRRPVRAEVSRRGFFAWAVGALGGVFTLLVAVPLVGYLAAPLAEKREVMWARVCSLSEIDSLVPKQFAVTFRRENAAIGYDDVRGVFVIRRGDDILAFTNVCTHMECSVRWIDWHQQIICPCHGGIYDRWGILAGGPPAHSLPLFETRIEGDSLYVANRTVFRV